MLAKPHARHLVFHCQLLAWSMKLQASRQSATTLGIAASWDFIGSTVRCATPNSDILAMENPADRVCEGAVHVIKKFTRRAVVNLGRVRTNMPFHLRSRALRLWNC